MPNANEKQVEPELSLKVEILIHENGNISVTGPIKNPILMMDIFGRAMRTVADYNAKEAMERQRIIPVGSKIVSLN